MVFVARFEPVLEHQLNQQAQRLGRTRSSSVCEAIVQVVQRFGQDDEAMRQSAVIATHAQGKEWSEPCPDWNDWTA